MDPSHFRGLQPPTLHVVPGAPGASGHPAHLGFMEPPPPPPIPACSVGEILSVIRAEFASQNRLLSNRYMGLKQDYNDLQDHFRLSVQQTDRILAEQHARFEADLKGIKNMISQSCEGQVAALGEIRARLEVLERLTARSGVPVYDGSPEGAIQSDTPSGVEEATTPAAWSGAGLEVGASTTGAADDHRSLESGEPPVVPVTDPGFYQGVPPQVSLFDTPSPLTPTSTPRLESQEPQTPIPSSEVRSPVTHPPSTATSTQKRKRSSHRDGAARKSRRKAPEEKQEDVPHPEDSHATIWPPIVEGDTQKYVGCDKCAKWFHPGCVGLPSDHDNNSPWECPLCVCYPTSVCAPFEEGVMCSRPGCHNSASQEFFIYRLLGRCHVPNQGTVKYLVAWEGYPLEDCTWEPPEHFPNDSDKIKEFLEWWATENPMVDVGSLNPHETIFLDEAFALARAGITWPGDS